MVTVDQIRRVGEEIGDRFSPDRVILFGSHAQGAATEHSDVDLFVIMPFDGPAAEKSAQIRLAIRCPFPLDVIVRSPEAVERRLQMGDGFVRDILDRGEVLYETRDG